MLQPLTADNLNDHLAAFADGELDAAQAVALWTFLDTYPEREAALQTLELHQQLTNATKRSLSVAVTPDDLRARITAMIDSTPTSPAASQSTTQSHARFRRIRYPLAAAAGLIIGISATAFMLRESSANEVMPGEFVTKVGRVHAECSRLPEAMHDAKFEAIDASLATTVRAGLKIQSDAPDFTAAGFNFVGAGPCHAAGPTAVHLLYRSVKFPPSSAISLFVQSDTGQYPRLADGRVYRVSSPTSPFPTLAWRSGAVIYVLLADSDKTEMAVLNMIHPTSADQIVTIASR